ncbi:hypothetical protein HYPSUDRAFT_66188 [Hypholoma sublateritium FD-334 SS-4]|uniref:F-box domain-containing protein n=1 Tax=Hypholoma sublateritium (strain FD-334 SS-4) TaxID=945553 RepID=A0A0D2L8F5_HYPSF|nr:hypothetical protein HYPSUDRAFT_66188 [Hypholoma sublateritium FD-334 SS-4]
MVFGNLDIMEMVFNAFSAGNSGGLSTRQFLLWAALTSKDFFNPAMNALWRSLDSLFPILSLIPNPKKCLSWTATNEDLSAMDDISEEDVITQRAEQYRRRVRHLTLTGRDGLPSIADYIYLFNRLPSEFRLFPCLQSFTVYKLDRFKWEDLQGLFYIPSPTLSRVDFWGIDQGSRVRVENFLARLSRMKSGSLVTLGLEGGPTANCLRVLQQYSNLKHLSLGLSNMANMTAENLLKTIVRLVNLRYLTLACWCDECDDLVVPSTVFPAGIPLLDKLESLEVIGPASLMCAVVGATSRHMPNLKTLFLKTSFGDESLAMVERCFKDATVHVPLVERFLLDVATEDDPFHWNLLKFVGNWKSLKRLDILTPTIVVDSGGDESSPYLVLPNGLESLECLTLNVQHFRHLKHGKLCPITKHTFLAFPRIAECFPKLLSLNIYIPFPVDPAELEIMKHALTPGIHRDPEHGASSDAVPHGLRWLAFRDPVPPKYTGRKPSHESAMIVARYLRAIFPRLENVNFNGVVEVVGKRWCNTISGSIGVHKSK